MMSPRRVVTLLAVALVVAAVALWLPGRRAAAPAAQVGSLVLPGLKTGLDTLRSVRLESHGAGVTLVRGEAGWSVEERHYPADPVKLRKLLLGLAELKVAEEKTSDPSNYARLGVEDPGPEAASVRVEAKTPSASYDLLVGKVADNRSSYVRVPGTATSLLASPQVAVDADPKRWIDATLVDLPADRIESVAVWPATGPAWHATRAAATDGLTLQDLPKGKTQRSAGIVTPVAAMLTGLHIEDVANAPDAAPAGPHVELRTFDGVVIELHGRSDGDKRYIRGSARSTGEATASEAAALESRLAGREFEVLRYKYDALFRPLADFT